MSFEQTEKYKNKLDQIRRQPQDTPEEKDTKREHAREFRMEVMLDNALVMRYITERLESDPWGILDKESLMELIRIHIAKYLAHPEVAETFIDDMLATRKIVKDEIDKKITEQDGKLVAEAFYHDLVCEKYPQYKFNGKMDLDISYPLAIILYVENEEDFKRIDPRNNIGGFYRSSASSYSSLYGKSFQFPLIVIKGSKENSVESGVVTIEEHEKGHAEHKRLMSALEKSDRKAAWIDFKIVSKNKPEEVMDYALERAKDELLAEFKVTGSLEFHLENLLRKQGVYDYFKELHIEPDSDLYSDFWKEYEKKLRSAVLFINHLLNAYKMFGLSQRIDLMRWVLAQIPLKDWDKQMTESAFWEEANGLYNISAKSLVGQPNKEITDAREEFITSVRSGQSHSFFQQINQFQARLK